MKKIILSISLILLSFHFFGQQIVFTTLNSSSEEIFMRINVSNPFVYENITDAINTHALFPGNHKGPISVSHKGDYYVFKSERFESPLNTDGYEAITICKSDFTNFEVPKDQAGNVFHADGIMQISSDGNTIYCVKAGPANGADVYKITRIGNYWEEMDISASSTFNINKAPYLSYLEDRIIFESSNDVNFSTAISQVLVSGVGLSTYTSISEIPGATQIKSPCYDNGANVYFEAETDGERVWKINVGGTPEIVNNSFTNDNSPITLFDGRIVSVYIPQSTHQLKVMNSDGTSESMLTQSVASFEEIFDIGISAGDVGLANISKIQKNNFVFSPNPAANEITISNLKQETDFVLKNPEGKIVQNGKTSGEINVSTLKSGVYFLTIADKTTKLAIQ